MKNTFLSIFLNDSSSNKHRSVRTSEASTKLTLAVHPLSSVSSNSMPLASVEEVGRGWVRQFNQPITRTASRDRSKNIPNQSSCNPFQCPFPSKPLKFFYPSLVDEGQAPNSHLFSSLKSALLVLQKSKHY